MSNDMLEQLRGNLQRESSQLLRSTNKDPQMTVDIETHAQGNISNNGATYHKAIKDQKGYFFDKNMVLQRGLVKVEMWVDSKTGEPPVETPKIEESKNNIKKEKPHVL